MNINQMGIASLESGKEPRHVSAVAVKSSATVYESPIFTGKSSILNRLSSQNAMYRPDIQENETKSSVKVEQKKVSDYLDSIRERITENDVQDLEEEGMSLEKYESERLDRALSRIKENRREKRESVKQTVETRESKQEDIQQSVVTNAIEDPKIDKVAVVLAKASLPVTNENMQKVSQVLKMAGSVEKLGDEAKQYLIMNDTPLSIKNIYMADYSAVPANYENNVKATNSYQTGNILYDVDGSGIQKNSSQDWQEVKKQAEDILTKAGIEITEESLKECQWLFENNLPVNEKTINKLSSLSSLQENFNEENILEKIVMAYEKGINPENTILETIDKDKKNSLLVNDFLDQIDKQITDGNHNIDNILYRRQLEEIRLKMTFQAGKFLADKGIKLDIKNLSQVVDGLKQMEQNYYQSMMEEKQEIEDLSDVHLLWETQDKVKAFQDMPVQILGNTFLQRDQQSIRSLYQVGTMAKEQFVKAGESYEKLMTQPRKDLGDSYKKAFEGIDLILEELEIEKTDEARRAIRILGYNHIEIDKESIIEMKEYDAKVQNLIRSLKPAVTMEMIRRGINPLDATIDEVNRETNEINHEIGISGEEKYGEFLWEIEKKKEITSEERKAYIGIYRLLNQVEKSDGAAIGSVIKSGRQLTLGNLLTATRISHSEGIDSVVNDELGQAESGLDKDKLISTQVSYFRREASSARDALTLESLQQLTKESDIDNSKEGSYFEDTWNDLSFEQFCEWVKQFGEKPNHSQAVKNKMDILLKKFEYSQEDADYLLDYDMPLTIENIALVDSLSRTNVWKQIYDKGFKNTNQKEKYIKSVSKVLESLGEDDFQTEYENFSHTTEKIVYQEMYHEEQHFEEVNLLNSACSAIQLARNFSRKESYYFPVITDGNIANINLKVEHRTTEKGRVTVSYQSEKSGEILSEWRINEGNVQGFVMADNAAVIDALKHSEEWLKESVASKGLEMKQIHFSVGLHRQRHLEKTGDSSRVDTRQLFNMAQIFIKGVQNIVN